MNPAPNSQSTEPETIETVEIPPASPDPEEVQPVDLAQSFTARRFRNMICHPSDKTKPFGQQMQKIAADLLRRFKPRDPVEEMLIAQMVWTHARVANLSTLFSIQPDIKWHSLMALETDRAANLFRRQMLALADYRRPTRRSFTAIRQANIADQQIVNSHGDSDAISEEEKAEISVDPANPPSPPTRSLEK